MDSGLAEEAVSNWYLDWDHETVVYWEEDYQNVESQSGLAAAREAVRAWTPLVWFMTLLSAEVLAV